MSENDDWLAAERERHGPVTEQDVHDGYDMYLDAMLKVNACDIRAALHPLTLTPPLPHEDVSEVHIERGED
jgi:hypothetical protein